MVIKDGQRQTAYRTSEPQVAPNRSLKVNDDNN